MPLIYTIGHSSHRPDVFLDLLQHFSIDCLIDVRSIAASAYNPQYNKEPLSNFLKLNGIKYIHLAEEFGARHTDPDVLDQDGKVNFELVRKKVNFRHGVERIWNGVEQGETIVLMCSEAEPFDCHRFSMISNQLEKEGLDVRHILKDKLIKTNADLEEDLIKKYKRRLPQPDIFNPDISYQDQLEVAYRLRNKDIAFSPYSKQTVQELYD